MSDKWLQEPIKGLLLDISGVLKNGDKAIVGSVEAIKRLQSSGLPFRLLTNESSTPISVVVSKLRSLGYRFVEEEIFAPIPAVIKKIKILNLRPHLFVSAEVMSEFAGIDTTNPNCVVIGDAGFGFTYDAMNAAFHVLMDLKDPLLYSMGIGKYYMNGEVMELDVGPFTKALEYATGAKSQVVGKPSAEFFLEAVSDLCIEPHQAVMIGDDLECDIMGAQKSGLRGVLVRTGKYRPCDENNASITPDAVVDDLLQAVNLILAAFKR